MNVTVLFYSMHGHTWRLAEAEAAGASEVAGAEVKLLQVPETLTPEIIEKAGGTETRKQFAHIPVATLADLANVDALIIGTPTRFGNMCGQMRAFFDGTGALWMEGALAGKVGSVFTSTASQHGGQETTVISSIFTLMHHGMIIVGVPFTEPGLLNMAEISGGTPYGATTICDHDGSRMPSENELTIARSQGRRVAQIASKLFG